MQQVFVSKLNADGSALVFSATLGDGNATSIAVDCVHDVYLTGGTFFGSFPTTPGAFQTTGLPDGTSFIVKLSQEGSKLAYSTFFGGGHETEGLAIAADCAGHAYVAGQAYEAGYYPYSNFPTTYGALQRTTDSSFIGYVAKFKPDGSAPLYSTLLGDDAYVSPYGFAIDSAGDAYVAGYTTSGYPVTPGAFQQTVVDEYQFNGFVSKLNPGGTALVYSTYLGNEDGTSSIALDAANHAYVTGIGWETCTSPAPLMPPTSP
jgi:hypothetical protein